ncbi:MAG TPA: HAD-IIB family hydrolase, partial [Polyangiaceae bacterium]|nr:HAD-IIB family hydrolase [Polyangiaceae bacterium]
MKPITEITAAEAKGLQGLLFDLDDTLLTHGRLTEEAYAALFRLKESGLRLFCVTGRPITWGKLLVRQWPIEAAVCETGPLSVQFVEGRVAIHDTLSVPAREQNRSRLAQLVQALRERFSQLVVASDANERVSDFTFDIGETQPKTQQKSAKGLVDEASQFAEQWGARTNRSSVHLHVTFDAHDKASGTLHLLARQLGLDPTTARKQFAYVGDSENDAPCFAAFKVSIAVANLQGAHTLLPSYQTRGERGAGF